MSWLKDSMYKIYVKRNVLDSLLLSDGFTGKGVIDNVQHVANQQGMVAFILFQS